MNELFDRLSEDVGNDWHIRPACLPSPEFIEYENKPEKFRFKVTGFGKQEFGKGELYHLEVYTFSVTRIMVDVAFG